MLRQGLFIRAMIAACLYAGWGLVFGCRGDTAAANASYWLIFMPLVFPVL